MRIRSGIVLALLAVVCTAAPAQAQWVASPYLGINLGGDAEFRKGGPADPSDISAVGWGSSLMFSVTTISSRTRRWTSFPITARLVSVLRAWTSILTRGAS
jgi:hypothetical protein